MMSWALVVQMKGSGLSFQNEAQVSMTSTRSCLEPKLVLASALRVRIENQVSIRFSHDAEVGVKLTGPCFLVHSL